MLSEQLTCTASFMSGVTQICMLDTIRTNISVSPDHKISFTSDHSRVKLASLHEF